MRKVIDYKKCSRQTFPVFLLFSILCSGETAGAANGHTLSIFGDHSCPEYDYFFFAIFLSSFAFFLVFFFFSPSLILCFSLSVSVFAQWCSGFLLHHVLYVFLLLLFFSFSSVLLSCLVSGFHLILSCFLVRVLSCLACVCCVLRSQNAAAWHFTCFALNSLTTIYFGFQVSLYVTIYFVLDIYWYL